eukprot:15103395-Heterocapsa_arctica.AAC.1
MSAFDTAASSVTRPEMLRSGFLLLPVDFGRAFPFPFIHSGRFCRLLLSLLLPAGLKEHVQGAYGRGACLFWLCLPTGRQLLVKLAWLSFRRSWVC